MISKTQFLNGIKEKVFSDLLQLEPKRIKTLLQFLFLIFISIAFLLYTLCNFKVYKNTSELIVYFVCLLIASYCVFGKSSRTLLFLSGIFAFLSIFEYTTISLVILFALLSYIRWITFINSATKVFCSKSLEILNFIPKKEREIPSAILQHLLPIPYFNYIKYKNGFSGKLKSTKFLVEELELRDRRIGYRGIDATTFSGIFIDITIKQTVDGYVFLLDTIIPQWYPGLQKIKPSNIGINKQCQIFSNNETIVQNLLTPQFIKKYKELKHLFKNKRIDISMFNNHVIFTIHTAKPLFSVFSLFKKTTDIKGYEKFYDEIESILDMVEVCNIKNAKKEKTIESKNNTYFKIITAKKKNSYFLYSMIGILFFVIFLLILM